ncbi:MAG: adenine phosphoribosyltransferase [Oscillospiraceae bacterium]|nr:adenine phosphoribosyltransferase [Oscillospiraceae bacterium]
MDYFELHVAGLTRQLPICKVNDEISFAAFVMFGDVELTERVAEELCKKVPEFDVIVTAEAKGIPLAYAMARISGKTYIPARKAPKLYMHDPISIEVKSISTAVKQTLWLDQSDIDKINGARILIVDDVISTGSSLLALEDLVNQAGGNIVGKAFVLAEGDAAKRDDIYFLGEIPIIQNN